MFVFVWFCVVGFFTLWVVFLLIWLVFEGVKINMCSFLCVYLLVVWGGFFIWLGVFNFVAILFRHFLSLLFYADSFILCFLRKRKICNSRCETKL